MHQPLDNCYGFTTGSTLGTEPRIQYSPIQYKYIKMKAHVIPRVYHRLNSAALLLREAAPRAHRDILLKILISKREAADWNLIFC